MKKKFLVFLSVLIAMALSTSVYAKPYGTIRVAIADFSYESTDPIFWESFWGMGMYDQLAYQNEQGDFVPSAAESWSLSADGMTWTFKIRRDIKFHNGDPLTAEDVAWSLKRFSSKESTNPWSPYLRNNQESIEAVDRYTVVYKMARPEPMLIVSWAWCRILPKKYFESVGQDEFRKNPIGSGPWKWSKLVPKTRLEMVANTEYWGKVPAYAKYVELMVPEESTRVAMLKRGDVDIVIGASIDRQIELRKAGYKLQVLGAPTVANVSFQGTWYKESGPMYHKQFRQALSYAINRQELCDTLYQGLGKPGSRWFMYENTWGWNPDWKADPYDPEKVKRILKEINYPRAFKNPVVQIYLQGGWPQSTHDLVQAVAGYWEEAGIQVKINVLDAMGFANYFFVRMKDETAGNVGAVIPWVYSAALNNVYHSANMFKSTGIHSTGNDPVADRMYNDVATELDMDISRRKWTAFYEYNYDMWVNVGILQVPTYIIVGPKLGKFTAKTNLTINEVVTHIEHN